MDPFVILYGWGKMKKNIWFDCCGKSIENFFILFFQCGLRWKISVLFLDDFHSKNEMPQKFHLKMNSEENFSFSIFPLSAMNHNENYLENGLFFMQIGCHKKRYLSLGLWTSLWTLKKPSLIRICCFKALFALWKENWIGNWHTFSSFSF